jgi:hypothetical protein
MCAVTSELAKNCVDLVSYGIVSVH